MEPIADEKAHPGHGLGGSGEGSSGDGVLLRRRVASAGVLLRRWNLWKVEGESLVVVLGVWWREGLSYSSPWQRIDGEGGGGGVLADTKNVEEAALPGGVSSEDKGKMGSVRDAKKDDANGFSRGSPEGNQWQRGLAGTDAGARVPAVPRDFLPWARSMVSSLSLRSRAAWRWNRTSGRMKEEI
ncbi:Os07g0441300 [Oryza sativa Japonica Group]|jgi:hypothetical protein|uniref:Os07g0441300 protein n=2 Tax=Oryza TaxID=4527 RepID=A0A0P0X5G5_ORYSJ|nr:Os07g0441300 [Oryza sativa Japonica Group]